MPLTDGALDQDWWLLLVGCAFGEVRLLPTPTILYRRHSANYSSVPLTADILRALQSVGAMRQRMERLISQFAPQAEAFLRRFGNCLPQKDVDALRSASLLPVLPSWKRKWLVVRHGLWFSSMAKNIAFFVLL